MAARDGRAGGEGLRGLRPRLYGRRWDKAAKRHLAREPLCRACLRRGRVVAATVVDHVEPHRGDPALFWDPGNRQSLCKHCHDADKQREEIRGYSDELGDDGWPIDPRHPANAERP